MTTFKQQIKDICDYDEEKLGMLAVIAYVSECDEDTNPTEFFEEIEDKKNIDEDEAAHIKLEKIEELVGYIADPSEKKYSFERYMRVLAGDAEIIRHDDWDTYDGKSYYKNGVVQINNDADLVTVEWRYYYHDDAGKILFWTKEFGWFDGQKYTEDLEDLTKSYIPE